MFHNGTHKPLQRSIALCCAAMLTLAMLGGIDHLATPGAPPALWAADTASRG